MTTEIKKAVQSQSESIGINLIDFMVPRLLHSFCHGPVKSKSTIFAVHYFCNNPVCPHYQRLIPVDKILVQFKQIHGDHRK